MHPIEPELCELLQRHFTYEELQRCIRHRHQYDLSDLVRARPMNQAAFELVCFFVRHNELVPLCESLASERPYVRRFYEICEELTSETPKPADSSTTIVRIGSLRLKLSVLGD